MKCIVSKRKLWAGTDKAVAVASKRSFLTNALGCVERFIPAKSYSGYFMQSFCYYFFMSTCNNKKAQVIFTISTLTKNTENKCNKKWTL